MKKALLFALCIVFSAQFISAQTCIPNPIYTDSVAGSYPVDLPPMVAGQPYFETVTIITFVDTIVVFSGITVDLKIKAMRLLTITGLPPGFTFQMNDSIWANGGSDPNFTPVMGCFTVTASANAVDAAIANSDGGTGIYNIVVYYDVLAKGNPIPSTYTWMSEIGTPPYGTSIVDSSSIGGNTGSGGSSNGCDHDLYYNGLMTDYAGLPATSGSYNLYLDLPGPGCNWAVTGTEPWISISPSFGFATANLTVNYQANTTGSERYANIMVGNQQYLVTQISEDCNVVMSVDSSFVGPLEGTIYVTVTAADSCYWSILNRSEFCDWIDVNPVQGTGSGTIEIHYDASNAPVTRECELNFSGTTITIAQQSPLSVKETDAIMFNVYPNPANDFITISTPTINGKELVSIYDVSGQLISQTPLTTTNQQINTANLSNGLYVFVVQNSTGIAARKKVIINR